MPYSIIPWRRRLLECHRDPIPGPQARGRPMKRYDTVVIGGGIAGLTSAAALAAAGRRVLVLEQYSVVGGSTHVFRRKGRWEWQVGVHHLPDCGPNGDIPTVFRGLGLAEHITFEPMDRTGYERYV